MAAGLRTRPRARPPDGVGSGWILRVRPRAVARSLLSERRVQRARVAEAKSAEWARRARAAEAKSTGPVQPAMDLPLRASAPPLRSGNRTWRRRRYVDRIVHKTWMASGEILKMWGGAIVRRSGHRFNGTAGSSASQRRRAGVTRARRFFDPQSFVPFRRSLAARE
jgi:hypothetical protein